MNLSLREYQHDLINNIRSEYRHGAEAVLLQSPTGSGKTIMFAYITESAARKGKRIIILVHRQAGHCLVSGFSMVLLRRVTV